MIHKKISTHVRFCKQNRSTEDRLQSATIRQYAWMIFENCAETFIFEMWQQFPGADSFPTIF